MIVAKAPLRLSFLGGGTDTNEFMEFGSYGCVLGTTINRYVYVFVDDQPSFESNRYKFTYRRVEEVYDPKEFIHPVVREMLVDLEIKDPLNIATMANLPGRSGLGSSSAFTVGLYSALLKRSGQQRPLNEIAKYAIYCERELMGESGGFQDQYHSAFGGFRLYKFHNAGAEVSTHLLSAEDEKRLNESMLLVATIKRRSSSEQSTIHVKNLSAEENKNLALEQRFICEDIAEKFVKSELDSLSKMRLLFDGVNASWNIKRRLIGEIDEEVETIINIGLRNGAQAAKLCGAGGSGFVLFLAEPEDIQRLQIAFNPSQVVKPKLESSGVNVYEF